MTCSKTSAISWNVFLDFRITRNMFQGLSELYSLDLKGNNISIVEDRAWSKLPSLRHLDISSNKITHLGTATFAGTFEKSNPLTTRILYIYGKLHSSYADFTIIIEAAKFFRFLQTIFGFATKN